jgi:hypothetical protein
MVAPLVLALALPSLAAALTPLSDDILGRVIETASTSTLSWENGTLARALTDFNHPALSPFRSGFVGALASNDLEEDSTLGGLARATLVSKIEAFGPSSLNASSAGALNGSYDHLSLLDDGAAGDPASLGASDRRARALSAPQLSWGRAQKSRAAGQGSPACLPLHPPPPSIGDLSRRGQASWRPTGPPRSPGNL